MSHPTKPLISQNNGFLGKKVQISYTSYS